MIRLSPFFFVLSLGLPLLVAQSDQRWKVQYSYKKLDSLLELRDIKCPSAERCVAAGVVFSSHDYLFTSGTLGRYCSRLNSTNEAKDAPWSSPKSSSTSTQSWWSR